MTATPLAPPPAPSQHAPARSAPVPPLTPSPPRHATSLRPFFADRRFTALFLTDVWERFSFYGMQALLFLFAVAPAERGGLGMPAATAGALFGLYMSTIFLACVPGGWLGDRVLGPKRAMLFGATGIAIGHYFLAVPARPTFYVGLIFIAAGTGLLKPSMPVMFAELYPRAASAQREAAFSVFYMSIHVSALVAPLVTGVLGERVNWHLGFGAAAAGMTLGVLQLVWGVRHFGDAGARPPRPASPQQRRRAGRRAALVIAAMAVLLGAGALAGRLRVEPVLGLVGLASLATPVLYFRHVLRSPRLRASERRRLRAFLPILLSSALFWMMFSQHGSTFLRFADESTDRDAFGWQVPASWFQSASPLFLLVAAPLLAMLWLRLGERMHAPAKIAAGLALTASSFGVLVLAALAAARGHLVSPLWLLAAFALHALGELCISPVGLSVTAEVAPSGSQQQLMGMWLLGGALGSGLGGGLARAATAMPLPAYFGLVASVGLAAAALLAASAGRLHRRLAPAQPSAQPPAEPSAQPPAEPSVGTSADAVSALPA